MPAWFAAMLCSALLAAEALAGPGLLIAVEDDWPPYSARGAVSSAPRGWRRNWCARPSVARAWRLASSPCHLRAA